MDVIRYNCLETLDEWGLSVRSLAARASMPEATARNYLHGESKNPSFETVAKICSILQVSMDAPYNIITEQTEKDIEQDTLIRNMNVEIERMTALLAGKDRQIFELEERKRSLQKLSGAALILCFLLVLLDLVYLVRFA